MRSILGGVGIADAIAQSLMMDSLLRPPHQIGPGRATIRTHAKHIVTSWSGKRLRAMRAENGVGRPPRDKA